MMDKLIHSNPFAILKPLLKLRKIGILRIFRRNNNTSILVILIITEFLSDIVEA